MECYTGLVIDDGSGKNYEQVLVYIPEKDGTYFFGSSKTVGKNLLNSIGATEINVLRMSCKNWCYVTTPPNSGSVVSWDEESGIALMNSAYKDVENDSVDLRKGTQEQLNYYSPINRKYSGDNQNVKFVSSPDMALHYSLSLNCGCLSKDGFMLNENTNNPKGSFTKITVGTKVLVMFPNESSEGYIVAQITPASARSKVLKNTLHNYNK